MAKVKKPYVDLFNLIQVDSLELSKQLLTKKYYLSRLYLSVDEYSTDDVDDETRELLWRRGDYQVGLDGNWDSISDGRNLDPATQDPTWVPEVHTKAPYYNTASADYDGTKDPTNIAGQKRADNTDATDPFYIPGSNPRYKFISLRGTISPELGFCWEKDSVSGAVDGDNISFSLSCHWVPRNLNKAQDLVSAPYLDYPTAGANATYEPYILPDGATQFVVNPAYDSSRDWTNVDPKKDTRAEATEPYDPTADKDTAITNWADKKGYNHAGRPVVYPYWNEAVWKDVYSSPDFPDTYKSDMDKYVAAHDSSDTTGAYNGGNYGLYFRDTYAYTEIVVDNLEVQSDEDYNKNIIGFTNNSLATPVALVLTDNRVLYGIGDKVFVPTGKTDIGEGKKGTDWSKTPDTIFTDDYFLEWEDLAKLSDNVMTDATKSMVVIPEISFHVDTLVMDVNYTKK